MKDNNKKTDRETVIETTQLIMNTIRSFCFKNDPETWDYWTKANRMTDKLGKEGYKPSLHEVLRDKAKLYEQK